MRIVLTGATGFIGRAFIRHAVAAGHTVCALARPATAASIPAYAGVTVAVGTLGEPPWGDLARFRPETCVHAAWITAAGVYVASPTNDRYAQESLAFLTGLIERGVEHVVALGTCAEYRPAPSPLHETRAPLDPRSPYARAKHQLRLGLEERGRLAGVGVAWARIFQAYGAGEPGARLCSTVARRLLFGERVMLETPRAVRDWIHVDDIAAALLHLVTARAGDAINVGSGIGHTVESVAHTIARLLGRPSELVAAGAAAVEPPGPLVADVTRLRALGWAPGVELEVGLAGLVEGLR
jgi:nucleoside-diphosphate-sugar epimerase